MLRRRSRELLLQKFIPPASYVCWACQNASLAIRRQVAWLLVDPLTLLLFAQLWFAVALLLIIVLVVFDCPALLLCPDACGFAVGFLFATIVLGLLLVALGFVDGSWRLLSPAIGRRVLEG